MTTIYLVTNDALAIIRDTGPRRAASLHLVGRPTQCVAADPLRPEQVYCGTMGQGLWYSEDAGHTWRPAGAGIAATEVMAVAVSAVERVGRHGLLWAGTEPSALYCSADGAATWQARPTLQQVPSAPTWSFPPRPWTHHVRWIAPDPQLAGHLYVGIELGGVMRSRDGGLTWDDRQPGSQHDAHVIRTHQLAPGRVYEAAGGGYAESHDGGDHWQGDDTGRRHHYLWGLAIDPADPDTLIVSAASGARAAHSPASAESYLYRRTATTGWQPVADGLPAPPGTRALVLAANEAEPHVFYAASRDGALYRSPDAGQHWTPIVVDWPAGYQITNVEGLVVAAID